MTTVGEKYFSERCQDILNRLDADGVVITRDGVPFAKVVPLESEVREGGPTAFSRLNGIMKGKIKIHGDIMSTGEKWDAEGGM